MISPMLMGMFAPSSQLGMLYLWTAAVVLRMQVVKPVPGHWCQVALEAFPHWTTVLHICRDCMLPHSWASTHFWSRLCLGNEFVFIDGLFELLMWGWEVSFHMQKLEACCWSPHIWRMLWSHLTAEVLSPKVTIRNFSMGDTYQKAIAGTSQVLWDRCCIQE